MKIRSEKRTENIESQFAVVQPYEPSTVVQPYEPSTVVQPYEPSTVEADPDSSPLFSNSESNADFVSLSILIQLVSFRHQLIVILCQLNAFDRFDLVRSLEKQLL